MTDLSIERAARNVARELYAGIHWDSLSPQPGDLCRRVARAAFTAETQAPPEWFGRGIVVIPMQGLVT